MNKILKTHEIFERVSVLLDCPTVSSEEFVAEYDGKESTTLIFYGKDILELVQSSKNIIDVDSIDENEKTKTTSVHTSFEMKNLMKITRGLLVTDHVILNHGQVTWTTPELAPPLLTTTPHQREDVSDLDRFNVHRCPTRRDFSGTGIELMTFLPRSD
ncbi:uncharacterized protein TNCV_4399141 [Trichonephila clavipes]|nr:uncharacterized protein TNCV_4399141 [Trichonephila clavipes]